MEGTNEYSNPFCKEKSIGNELVQTLASFQNQFHSLTKNYSDSIKTSIKNVFDPPQKEVETYSYEISQDFLDALMKEEEAHSNE